MPFTCENLTGNKYINLPLKFCFPTGLTWPDFWECEVPHHPDSQCCCQQVGVVWGSGDWSQLWSLSVHRSYNWETECCGYPSVSPRPPATDCCDLDPESWACPACRRSSAPAPWCCCGPGRVVQDWWDDGRLPRWWIWCCCVSMTEMTVRRDHQS